MQIDPKNVAVLIEQLQETEGIEDVLVSVKVEELDPEEAKELLRNRLPK